MLAAFGSEQSLDGVVVADPAQFADSVMEIAHALLAIDMSIRGQRLHWISPPVGVFWHYDLRPEEEFAGQILIKSLNEYRSLGIVGGARLPPAKSAEIHFPASPKVGIGMA